MATKLRLQRFGKKGKPFYHIVAADSRAPRDGKFIERIGSYNPNTNPATVDLNFDRALDWMTKGAQPTDTVRSILSHKGVLFMKHLMGGVTKGALTDEQVTERFNAWLENKEGRTEAGKDALAKQKEERRKAALEAETKVNQDKAAAIAAKNKPAEEPVAEETAEAEGEVSPAAEGETEAAPAEGE